MTKDLKKDENFRLDLDGSTWTKNKYVKWRSEYQPFEYQKIWKPKFWSSDFKWFGIQMVGLCAMTYVLDQPFEHQTST